jgi:Na+-driven multidrug efflux pump
LAVFNFVNYFFFFLNGATTVQVTQALAFDEDDGERASRILSNAVLVAFGCGVTLAAALLSFARPLVAATGCIPELLEPATRYLRVRALGQPIVLTSMVVQAGLLAQRDALTPMQVISTACVLNIIGDVLWVPKLGAVGAAWATLVAQLVTLPLLLLLSAARKRLQVRLRVPRRSELVGFFSTATPLFFFEMGLATCYVLIQSLSTQFNIASAAAFQAIWTPVSVLAFATYPLKQAAQVFLPPLLTRTGTRTVGGEPMSKEFLKVLVNLCGACSAVLAATGIFLASRPALFTADAALWPLIASFAPYVGAILLMMGFAQVLEGVLLGTGDLSFLSCSQLGNVLAAVMCLLATRAAGLAIHGTWLVFLAFITSRALQASIRVFVAKRPWDDASIECTT